MNIVTADQPRYIVAAVLFIFGLKMLSSPARRARGNLVSAVGMLIAVVATLFDAQVIDLSDGSSIGVVVGSAHRHHLAR